MIKDSIFNKKWKTEKCSSLSSMVSWGSDSCTWQYGVYQGLGTRSYSQLDHMRGKFNAVWFKYCLKNSSEKWPDGGEMMVQERVDVRT